MFFKNVVTAGLVLLPLNNNAYLGPSTSLPSFDSKYFLPLCDFPFLGIFISFKWY